jgi:uncharacterized protein (DUF2235 family)
VGTSSFKPLAILGGDFGYGLKRNVIDIYKLVCRNYPIDDDEIFGLAASALHPDAEVASDRG